jgi:tetratricopeptide (TPR) repeat protein
MSLATNALSPIEAYEELMRFAGKFGEAPLRLALHAAVPQGFRIDLLHLLKRNFVPEVKNEYTVEADVLLSPLCIDIGRGYFQFDSQVRLLLLDNLVKVYAGEKVPRVNRVANFLLSYANHFARLTSGSQDRLWKEYLETQRWVALAFLNPESAAQQFAECLQQAVNEKDVVTRLQLGSLAASLSTPLARYSYLLNYASAIQTLETKGWDEASKKFGDFLKEEITIGSIKLPPISKIVQKPVEIEFPVERERVLEQETDSIANWKAVVGVFALASALFLNRNSSGNFNFDEFPKVFLGETFGGVVTDCLRQGLAQNYNQLKAKYSRIELNKDILNYDLQRTARKARLIATFFAAQHCLEQVKAENKSKDDREAYLNEVIKYLSDEIKNVENVVYRAAISFDEFVQIFDIYQRVVERGVQAAVSNSLKEDILRELEIHSTFPDSKFDPDAFSLLATTLQTGWEELSPKGGANEHFVKPDISSLERAVSGKKYDWFYLVCSIFNEEYKTNPRIEATTRKQLLLKILAGLETFGTLKSDISTLTAEISNFADDLKKIREGVDEANQGIKEIKDLIRQSVPEKSEAQNLIGLPSLRDKVYGREEELRLLLDFLEWGKQFGVIIAPSGFGKTYLIKSFLWTITEIGGVKGEYRPFVEKVIYLDCRANQTMTQILQSFANLLGKELEYLQSEEKHFLRNLFTKIQTEKILLIFDNFESWIDENGRYSVGQTADRATKDESIETFLNALFNSQHQIRGIFVSQKIPNSERDFVRQVEQLKRVSDELGKGLKPEVALELVRKEGANVGLDKVSEEALEQFFERVHYIPQAIQSMIGYLETRGVSFAEFGRYFWEDFVRDENLLKSIYKEYGNDPIYDPILQTLRRGDYAMFFRLIKEKRKKGYLDEVHNYLERAMLDPQFEKVPVLNEIAITYRAERKLEKAIETLHRAIEINPYDVKTLNELAICYRRNKQIEYAIETLQRALEINPSNVKILNELAICFRENNQFEYAIEALQRALEINPNDIKILSVLTDVYKRNGDIERAYEVAQKGLKLSNSKDRILVKQLRELEESINQQKQEKRIKTANVLLFYSHKDRKFGDELNKHLASLKREGLIRNLYDLELAVGSEWEKEINYRLNNAAIILLLISPDFISEYAHSKEIMHVLERHEKGEVLVIPILIHDTYLDNLPFSKLQCLPRNAKAIINWQDQDEAFFEVAIEIRKAIQRGLS